MTTDNEALLETRCNGCESILSVTADTLAAGAGLVQCGDCNKVFNAAWNLIEQTPKIDRTKIDPRPRIFDLEEEHLDELQLPTTETESLVEIKRALRGERGFGPTGNQNVSNFNSTSHRTESRLDPSDGVGATANTAALRHVHSQTLDQPPKTPQNLIWFGALGVAVLALFLQTRYVLFDQLAAIPTARPYMVQVCKNIGCIVPLPLSGPVFRVIETKVNLHPDIPGVVIVKVRLLNRSTQNRTYPSIELALSDRNGQIVGRRTYSPKSFLATDNFDKKVPPGADVVVVVNLAQPEDNAVGFEARIVSS